jgi:predicted DNA-binding transcriptional regulator AlpA
MTDQQIIEQASTLPASELPRFLGKLEEARMVARSRLLAPAPVADQLEEKLLDLNEACEILGCKASFLQHRKKSLPFVVQVGRSVRYSRTGILKWIEKNKNN